MSAYNENGAVQFYNAGGFIKAVHLGSGVVAHIAKTNLVLQKDSATTFFIKSGSYVSFYKFSDVVLPLSTGPSALIDILVEWANASTSGDAGDGAAGCGADGLSRGGEPSTIVDIDTLYGLNPTAISEAAAGGAASAFSAATAQVTMSAGSNAGTRLVRQSKVYVPAVLSAANRALVSGTLGVGSVGAASNVVTRLGVFDDKVDAAFPGGAAGGNGVFFQWDAANGMSVVYRSSVSGSQVDYAVPRASWNLDPATGGGASAVVLSPASNATYVFDWNLSEDSVRARAGVLSSGETVFCHSFAASDVPAFGARALPVRWQLAHDAALGAAPGPGAALVQGAATVVSEAPCAQAAQARAYAFTCAAPKRLTVVDGSVPLVSLRLSASANRARLLPRRLTLINLAAGGVGRWDLVFNAALTGASYASPSGAASASSYAVVSTAETAATGGTVLASGYFYDLQPVDVALDRTVPALLAAVDGTPDVLTLVVTDLQGTVNVLAGVEWAEAN
jgi:hypothetical protein